jgi:hypothetical protein
MQPPTIKTKATLLRAFVAALLLLSLQFSYAQEPVVMADSLRAGDTISGAFKYGRRVITLPAGKWRLISYAERDSSTSRGGATMLDISFDEILEGRLNRILTISATKQSNNLNWVDEPCKTQGDSYWIDDRKRGFNDQFCVRIGYLSGIVDGARGEVFQTWARNIVSTGIRYSPDMPFVTVTRYTSYDYLVMRIGFNPEAYGIPRSKRPDRTFNDWNVKAIAHNPDRANFYEALKKWAPVYATATGRAFDGDVTLTSQDFGEPVFSQLK